MATALSNLKAASQLLLPRATPFHGRKPQHRQPVAALETQASQELQQQQHKSIGIPLQASRRTSLSLAVTTILHQVAIGASHAEEANNGWGWIDGPLPLPSVTTKIANEETGTRSFLRNGIYMANIGAQGSAYRIRMYAFDLLALGDLLGQDAWSLVTKYLCLKSTVMYYDFDKVINAAPEEQKQPLLNLANKLFNSIEKFDDAVKKHDESMTESSYADTTIILKEVMTDMATRQ